MQLPRPVVLQAVAIGITGLSSIAWLPVVGPGIARFAITLFAAATWIAVWALGGLERFGPRHRLLYAGIGAGIVAVIASSFSASLPALALTFGGTTGVSAPYWIALLVIMGMSCRVTVSGPTLNALRWQFAWGVPVAAYGIWQGILGKQVTAAYENANLVAPMMIVFLAMALGFARISPQRAQLWHLAAIVFFVAVLSARTLSGLVGLSVMTFFMALFAPGLAGLGKRLRLVIAVTLGVSLLLSVIFAVAYLANGLPPSIDRWAATSDFGQAAATRVEMWRAGLQEIGANPLFGVGPDQYTYEGQRFFSRRMHVLEHYSRPDVALPTDPHSIILLLPVNFGLLGSVAALVIAVAWARGVTSRPFPMDEAHLFRWSLALGALGFGYTTLFTPFALSFGGLPLMVTGLALMRAPAPRPYAESPPYARPRGAAAIVTLVFAVALGGGAIAGRAYFVAWATVLNGEGAIERAILVQPQVGFYRFVLLSRAGQMLARADVPGRYRDYQRQVDEAPPSVRGYAPYLVELVRLSTVDAGRTGRRDLEWERQRLAEARELSPHLPETILEQAHVEILSGDLEAAEALLEQARPWSTRIAEYPQYVLMLRAARGR